MNAEQYNGQKFIVTINRSSFRRRYVLNLVDEEWKVTKSFEPLHYEDFFAKFGFTPDWPHTMGQKYLDNPYPQPIIPVP